MFGGVWSERCKSIGDGNVNGNRESFGMTKGTAQVWELMCRWRAVGCGGWVTAYVS